MYFTNHDADRSDINCVVCNLSNSFAQLNEAFEFFLMTPHCQEPPLQIAMQNLIEEHHRSFFSTHTCSLALVECFSGREPLLVILEIAVSSNSVLVTRYC